MDWLWQRVERVSASLNSLKRTGSKPLAASYLGYAVARGRRQPVFAVAFGYWATGSPRCGALLSMCLGCRIAGMMQVTAGSASKYLRASSAQVVQPISLAKSGTRRSRHRGTRRSNRLIGWIATFALSGPRAVQVSEPTR
jgi:hypothetical protein